MDFMNFDNVLMSIYGDDNSPSNPKSSARSYSKSSTRIFSARPMMIMAIKSNIDPYIYISTHFDSLRNQIDIYASEHEITGKEHYELIQIAKEHEDECIQNLDNNFDTFQDKLNLIIEKRKELCKEEKETRMFLEKNINIRNEWIEARKEIFKKNLFFIDSFGCKKNGCLIQIEPFCIDDLQIDIIK